LEISDYHPDPDIAIGHSVFLRISESDILCKIGIYFAMKILLSQRGCLKNSSRLISNKQSNTLPNHSLMNSRLATANRSRVSIRVTIFLAKSGGVVDPVKFFLSSFRLPYNDAKFG